MAGRLVVVDADEERKKTRVKPSSRILCVSPLCSKMNFTRSGGGELCALRWIISKPDEFLLSTMSLFFLLAQLAIETPCDLAIKSDIGRTK